MAVRFDASTENYSRSLALGAQAALTVACWFKITVDRNDYSSVFFIDNGTSDNWGLQTGADGTTMATVFDASTQQGMGSLTVGTWYFVCLATNGTTGNLYHKTASAAGLTTVGVTSVTASVNAATLRIGESPWTAEWLNGCIAGFRVWTATLTAAEAQQESMQYAPNRAANLVSFHPFVKAETTDYSGNARTLSGGTGTTTEDGPPVPWRMSSPRLILPAAAGGGTVTGVASGLFGFTGTAAGSARTLGQAQAAFGFTATASGVDRALGAAVASFGFTATASGVDRSIGQATATFGFAATATGRPRVVGFATATFGFNAATSGESEVQGVATAAFGFTATALGFAGTPPVTGAASATFGFVGVAAATSTTHGQAVAVFGFTAGATGQPGASGGAAAAFGFVATAAGLARVLGVAATQLGFTAAATGHTVGAYTAPDSVSVSVRSYASTATARDPAPSLAARSSRSTATPRSPA